MIKSLAFSLLFLLQFQCGVAQVLYTWQGPEFGYCVPAEIQFLDQTSPLPSSWLWISTGPGTWTSNVQNPGGVYTIPGEYTVCLQVNNDPSQTYCQDFTFFSPPEAGFIVTSGVTVGCAPLTVLS